MRPNVVYDHYRWKKKIDQAMERSADGNNAGGGNKIPVLTGGAATGTSGTTTAAASNSPPRSAGGIMTTPTRRPNKRKSSSVNLQAGSPAARKRRKLQQAQLKAGGDPSAEQAPQTKNTVAVLNELKRNLVYNLESQTGPVHAPLFTMSVVVDGQKFIGHGRSKKLARIEAAAAALRSFIQFKDGATLTPIKPLQNVDFTSDDPMIENSIFPMSDTPALPEAIVTSPSMITANKSGSKGASEKAYIPRSLDSKERHNGPNHNNNNNNTNNNIINNNVHSTNNILAAAAAAATTTSSQKSSIATSLNNNNNKNSNIKNSRNTLNNNSSNNNPTNSGGSAATAATTTTSSTAPAAAAINIASNAAHNDHRQVVAKIQQSLDLFKNTNEKNVAWKKRLEITQQLCSKSTISGKQLKASAANASRNVSPGQPPKPQPEKGPVMLLHELFTDAHFECVSTEGLQHSKFTVVVTVDSQRFEGTGPSKKMAKNAAAKAALASMCNISFSPLQQAKFGALNSNSSGGGGGMGGAGSGLGVNGDATGCYDPKNVELPQTFADSIGKLVIEKFNEVMKGNDVYSRRKVLAGIVMTQAYDVRTAKVISLATGTKCVSGEHMSVTGTVINDSHAEIIARRGLLDYFYAQLDLHCRSQSSNTNVAASNNNSATAQYNGKGGNNNNTNSLGGIEQPEQESSIFVRPADGSTLYRLKDGINFHLYINTAPCGDARVFSPHENDNMDVDKHPNRKARGQLRTKVESGEGTIPVKSSEGIQTWDGVLQGQRLLTMSCSDKISRWNVLGLQGSLLASVIEPIYLHSIVLGSLLHPAHMYRAICGRVENSIQGLPPPYRLNKPKLALMTSAESRNQTKPPNFSINWVIGCSEVEIVNSFTGKLINNNTNTNKMSRLSKQSFYRRFAAAIERLPHARFREVKPTYFETKMCVPEYQQAKKELFAAFSKEDLGDWLKKPIEQDQFTLIPPKPEELMSASSGNTGSSNSSSSSNNGTGSNANGTTSGTK
ncbi:double-stranded RNA-specific editase Adar isoform X5 [Toxorhynchites rutilus septentrionalis]|uniref:double-stranded RNA-specific editase Adar isoform X5 n=1 Tax=Toxorhynchites rutilus septentrionalis TaxID=329112 RepID=UPI00247840CB|nr:double-stranded RNA-specific editase Adar isoform X5 [Toxorhynchites rutilus septentrionalis]